VASGSTPTKYPTARWAGVCYSHHTYTHLLHPTFPTHSPTLPHAANTRAHRAIAHAHLPHRNTYPTLCLPHHPAHFCTASCHALHSAAFVHAHAPTTPLHAFTAHCRALQIAPAVAAPPPAPLLPHLPRTHLRHYPVPHLDAYTTRAAALAHYTHYAQLPRASRGSGFGRWTARACAGHGAATWRNAAWRRKLRSAAKNYACARVSGAGARETRTRSRIMPSNKSNVFSSIHLIAATWQRQQQPQRQRQAA